MLNSIFYITITFVLNVILVILFLLVGGVLPLYERKFLSLIQRRVGPRYTGYKGRLQFIADSLKVLFKNYILLFGVSSKYMFLLPIFFLNINLLIVLNINYIPNLYSIPIEYNFIFFIILTNISNILIFFVGVILKNKYTLISSSRIANIIFTFELFNSIFLTFLFFVFKTFAIDNVYLGKFNNTLFFYLIPILIPTLISFLVDNGKSPFDQIEAETEIIMGYHVEYSGFLFGIFVLAEYLHVFFFIYLIIKVFNI